MRTVQPSIVIGAYTWDQDRLPRDEFQIRIDALHRAMDANGWKAVLVYGDAAEHAALAYFSNFTPRLRWAMALLPRRGDPRLVVAMSPRDLPAMRLMTWIEDIHSEANLKNALDSWFANFSGSEPIDIGAAGMDLMRPRLFATLENSLGNRFRPHSADTAVAACRTARPRALSLIRASSELIKTAAEALMKSWRGGIGAETAGLEAERAARLRAAQDVRVLTSLDEGRTFSPFRGSLERHGNVLASYLAVKHLGYWADSFVSSSNGISDVQRRTEAALIALFKGAQPGATAGALYRRATDALKPYSLHPVLGGSVGNRIGLSLEEGGSLTRDGEAVLAPGDIYTLHVGAYDFAARGAFASAMIAVTGNGHELLHRSPDAQSL
ncbi:MAG TPA: M24 family metallopeptidase [Xanthobacteraceae bacterium]|jgi:Xaa-Pro aminopeptidase